MPDLPETLYTAAQVREIERIAIEEQGVTGFDLMNEAGLKVFERIQTVWPKVRQLTVYCGAGNNGGDGYVVARLALEAGWSVQVVALAPPTALTGDAGLAWQAFAEVGGSTHSFDAASAPQGVVVDALFGTGLSRTVTGDYAQAIEAVNRSARPTIAVDIPSGLHADSGQVLGVAVKAQQTVTFVGLKRGMLTGDAAEYCGELSFVPLTLPQSARDAVPSTCRMLSVPVLPRRHRNAHKGQHGRLLLIGGNRGYSGAIRLAGEAALRSGAGLVAVATRPEHASQINIGRPELMCHGVDSVADLAILLDWADSVVLGPGLGRDDWARQLFEAAAAIDKPMVIDADGLHWLAQRPRRHDRCVLTPHPGEAARLLNGTTVDVARDRFLTAATLQDRFDGVCVLKGAGTLIADAKGIAVCPTGNPGMAGGGMGDVLAGLIGGLLAQHLSLTDAASAAVYCHGRAADILAARDGERGLLAGDLVSVVRTLLN